VLGFESDSTVFLNTSGTIYAEVSLRKAGKQEGRKAGRQERNLKNLVKFLFPVFP
jgi:hypothetical protein